jgi:poly-gamma-glutamate capsule biosynthesis protein CapA/YwtB (metallophosphatase superfamily)
MTKQLTLAVAGDIFFECEGQITADYKLIEKSHPSVWLEKIAPMLQTCTFAQGNLEGAVSDSLDPIPGKSGESNVLRMRPAVCDALKQAGFNVVTLANNHAMDFGEEGMLQTLANLERVGIASCGAGRDLDEARKPAILERHGIKVAFLAYCSVYTPGSAPAAQNKPGIVTIPVRTSYEVPSGIFSNPGGLPRVITTANEADVEKMREEVSQARKNADVVVVNFHWGLTQRGSWPSSGLPVGERPFYVLNYQEDLGRAAVDAGADLVVGHHPHRLQGVELYKGKIICYSVGNLTMGYSLGANGGEDALIVKGYINQTTKRLEKVHLVPIEVPDNTMEPELVTADQLKPFIAELHKVSKKYASSFRADGGEVAIARDD